MAGAVTITCEPAYDGVNKFTLAWTSHASTGNVTDNPKPIGPGRILSVEAIPSGSPTAPTNLYDLVLADQDGLDILGGSGADLLAAAPSYFPLNEPLGMPFRGGTLDVQITNAGNSTAGTIVLLVSGR